MVSATQGLLDTRSGDASSLSDSCAMRVPVERRDGPASISASESSSESPAAKCVSAFGHHTSTADLCVQFLRIIGFSFLQHVDYLIHPKVLHDAFSPIGP